MPSIMFVGGPWDSKTRNVVNPQQVYFAVQQPNPFDNFRNADKPQPSVDVLAQRHTYERVSGTRDPIIYRCVDTDRGQEAINFIRRIGIELEPWQEEILRVWFAERKED